MLRKLALLLSAACLPACLLADFSYDQSTKITGGALAGMVKLAGAFSKAAREPVQSTVAVKGNRMLHWNKDRASVIDLDAETITEINFQRKTYTVMTFAQMKQAMEQAMQQAKSQKGDAAPASSSGDSNVSTDFKMDVKNTGQTREISGFQAKERVMTMSMDATDQKSGDQGGMQIVSDMWIAPNVPGYGEIREFQKRMAKKLNWAPDMGGGMLAARPDLARGMADASKEIAKLDGVPVMILTKMIPTSNGQPVSTSAGSDAQSKPQPERQASPSLGDALSGKLGGFGGFGRKKKPKQDAQSDENQSNQQPSQSGDSSGTLMEMTTEMSNFSSAPVDPSRFSAPSGFKQVESEMNRRRRQ